MQYTYIFWSCGLLWDFDGFCGFLRLLFSREYVRAHDFWISTSEWGRLDIWMCFQNSFPTNKREQHPCFGNRKMQCNRQCKFNQVLADSSSNPVKHWKQSFCQEEFGLQDYHCFPPEASKTSTVTYSYLNILVVCASTGMFFPLKYRNREGHAWHMHL